MISNVNKRNTTHTDGSNAKAGDVVSWWYDTGAFGYTPIYGRVIRKSPKTLLVMHENGYLFRRSFYFFNRGVVTDPEETALAPGRLRTESGLAW